MRIARFHLDGQSRFGVIEDSSVRVLKDSPFDGIDFSGETIPLSNVKLLAPVEPSKIVCIGMNYAAHAAEINQDVSLSSRKIADESFIPLSSTL